MDDGLWNSEGKYPLLNCSYRDLSACVSYRINHKESRECIDDQQTVLVAIAWWVERYFVVNMYSPKGYCIVLPFFQWDFILVFWLWFVILADKTISGQGTNPVKHAEPVVKALSVSISLCRSHKTTHFIVMSKSETSQE